ncbi:MAG: PTS sugar transporter subunit IIA [Planctomycetota bacterium]
MKLSELLAPDRVVAPLEAEDKWVAIRRLAACAATSGAMPEAALGAVEDALITRERSMTTGMEHGIAIPHAAVDGLPDVLAVLGLSPQGIPFETLDGSPAQIIVCLIIPRDKKLLHIKTLAEIAKLLGRVEVRERLIAADTGASALEAIRDSDG